MFFVCLLVADAWHERLIRYYSFFGFKPVRRVGDSGLRDLPDLLVWGGVGTRMDADIPGMLRRWTRPLRRNSAAGAAGVRGSGDTRASGSSHDSQGGAGSPAAAGEAGSTSSHANASPPEQQETPTASGSSTTST